VHHYCGVAVASPHNVVPNREQHRLRAGYVVDERITVTNCAVEHSNFYDYRVPAQGTRACSDRHQSGGDRYRQPLPTSVHGPHALLVLLHNRTTMLGSSA